ncbi:unnamed protein product [Symbiodinium necroappetens]|uniref:Uncharacterized protein n=1 Tax=Symbiodinium necroappetens TaxID=1628268 RepID=A0A813CAU5_9DINO|nr:unnamed protein product [Symbiodinium necroappetens]
MSPACAEKDCSLVELLTNQEQPPAFYLVHYWGDLVLNALEAIKVHTQSRNMDQNTPYWLACCANRPHSLQDAFCPDLKATCFYKAMSAAKFQVVLMVDPKTDSNVLATCLSRLWCMYELCMCLDHPGTQFDVVQTKLEIKSPVKKASMVTQFLTPEEKDAELRTTGSGYKAKNDREKSFSLQIMEMALGVSVERAQITNLQEKQQILNIFAHRDLNEQAAEKQGSLDEVLHQICARGRAVPRHEAYDHVSKQLRALFALAFWRSLLSSSVAGCWAEMEPAFGTGRVMGGNVSDSDVHRVQGKLAVKALHSGLRHKSLELDMAFMQVCSEKLKMLRACLPSGLQELKLDLRETELNNQDIITFAAGLPRELEDLSLNLAGNEDINDDGIEVFMSKLPSKMRSMALDLKKTHVGKELMQRQGNYESMRKHLAEQAAKAIRCTFVNLCPSATRHMVYTVTKKNLPPMTSDS